MKKNVIVLIIGIAALISYLFLPYVSFIGQSVSFVELLDHGSDFGFLDILPAISAAVIILAAVLNKGKIAFGFSIAGLLSLIAQLGSIAEKLGQIGVQASTVFEVFGIGFWITAVLFIGGIVFSKNMNN